MKLQENPGDPLVHCRHLLATLSDTVPAVRCLRGRWSAVSATLDRLRAALDDLSDLPGVTSHPLAADLLRSLPSSLAAVLALSRHCAAPDPPAGKLRTQSDIAAAAASLDQLTADADLLLRSGAILDPPPPEITGSGRESARATARSLVTRLQMGGPAARSAALDELAALLQEDDKNVLIAAAHGVVPVLIRLLDSSCRETKEKAVAVVARVSAVESCRHMLAAEGALLLNYLARVLESDDGSAATESACVALQALTFARDNAMAIGSRGGVSSLVAICHAGTPATRGAAAGVLKNLAGVPELRKNFLEDNAIPVLIRVLSLGTVVAQENAVACLRNLAAAEVGQTLKHSIIKEGGLDGVKNYWDAGTGRDRNLEPAIGLLRNLASLKYIAEIIIAAGFLPLVVSALDGNSSSTRTEAARLFSQLALMEKARKEIGELGAVPRLVGMLEAKAVEEEDAAVKALASLVQCTANRRRFQKEEKGIGSVVQLLDPLIQGVDKKYPVAILQLVSQSRRCRKKIMAAGACGYLQWHVDMEVAGAKRLLDTLTRGNLWRMLALAPAPAPT